MKERFEVLDIFRGIFSSMVVFFHMSAFSKTPILNNNFIYNSDLFVDFFFVLSGFVITYSYQYISNFNQFGKFYKKRFLRLYPLHIIMLMAFLIVEVSKHNLSAYIHVNELDNADNNMVTFFSSVFLVNSVKIPGATDVSWNLPSWSISAEMIAYLVFGLMIIFINSAKLYKIRNLMYGVLLSLVLVIFYQITGSFKLTYSFDYGFLRSIIGFFTGVLCFNAYGYLKEYLRNLPTIFFNITETLIIFLILFLVWNKEPFKQSEYIYEILFFCSILIFAFEKGFISKGLNKLTLLKNIGKYSYSIYMTHALLLSIFNIVFIRILKLQPSAYAYLFLLNYLLIYFVSKWTYKHIEMRFSQKNSKPAPEKIIIANELSTS